MFVQEFKITCPDCGEELISKVLTQENEVIVEFLDDMEFYCGSCEATTYITVEISQR